MKPYSKVGFESAEKIMKRQDIKERLVALSLAISQLDILNDFCKYSYQDFDKKQRLAMIMTEMESILKELEENK